MSMTFDTNVMITEGHNLQLQGYGTTGGTQTLKVFYGICETAAGTNPKIVQCSGMGVSDVSIGTILFVKFANTATGTDVANIQMNVNNKGNINIKKLYNGAVNNLAVIGELVKDIPLMFVYNGTYWVLIGADYNSTWSTMTITEAKTVANASPNTNSRVIRADRLAVAIKRGAVLKVTVNNVGALPATFTATGVTANHEVTYWYATRSYTEMPTDWTVTTAENAITISGTSLTNDYTVDLVLYFGAPESVTATTS